MVDAPVAIGEILAGKYEVERVIGIGGMGVVVAARHLELDQRVAVKFLLPEIAERGDAAERFRREARAAVKITSEHVARVLDVGTMEGGVPFMVMEYLSGHDLSTELKSRRQLPVPEAVDYVLQACEAVAEAHAAGIVHRDLKPGNLFVARRADGSPVIKVLDFGISKSVGGSSLDDMALTKTAALIGSPLYMSPEQMHSAKSVDTRADIWSLGAIVYELLAGRPPYVGESLPQLCASLLNDTQPPLAEFRNDIPAELEHAVGRALQKDRTQRWQSVAELAQALAPFAPGSGRLSAERASRLLGCSSDARISVPDAPATGETTAATAMMSNQPTELATLASTPVAMNGPTQSSWGRTGAPPATRRFGRWLAVAGVGILAATAMIAFAISRTGASAEPVAAAPAPEPEGPVPVAAEVDPLPAAAASEPSSGAADAGAEAPASVESSDPPAPRVQPPVRAGSKPAGPAKGSTPKSSSGTITDFGGRR